MPAKAIWPSDSCPAQPVRTVSDRPHEGEHEDRRVEQVPRRLGDDERAARPRRRRAATSAAAVEVAHPPDAAEPLGDRPPLRRERERLRLAGPCRLWKDTAMSTATSSRKSISPGWSRKLKRMTASTTPMAMPATNARGNDTMPADHRGGEGAHERARAERGEVARPSRVWPADERHRERGQRARRPPTRTVDTSFGLMPVRRARSGFSADALTRLAERRAVEEPRRGRRRRAARRSGSTSCGAGDPDATPTSCTEPMACGNRAPGASMSGYAVRIASESWAMPMVATSTMTRGASKSRRMTISSMSAP